MSRSDIAPWLVRAKVSPARLPRRSAQRTQLLAALAKTDSDTIIAAQAAAGFGKTTLLCQWREALVAQGTPVAWLSVDQTDDPEVLLPYLAFAFEAAGVSMRGTGLLDPKYQGAGIANWLGLLVAQLERTSQSLVLILDDFERCSAESATSVIEPLLRRRPNNLRVCLAMRSNPGIALSSFRATGELLTIRAEALRFSKDEINELGLNDSDGHGLCVDVEATDGWPVAITLLADNSSSALGGIPGSDGFADYVREQLVGSQPSRIQQCLFAASIPKEIDAATLNAIFDCEDGAQLLSQLARRLRGLMLPVEAESSVFRLHPLVRETLEGELEKSDPALNAKLRRNAARWFEAQGRSLEAIRQAVAAGDGDLAARAFESMGAIQLFVREGMARFSRALQLLESFELNEYPRVHIARAAAAAKAGRIRESASYLSTAARALESLSKSGGQALVLAQMDSNIGHMLLSEYACEPTSIDLDSAEWRETIAMAESAPEVNALIHTCRCLFSLQMGHLEEGFVNARDAIEACLRANSTYGELFIHVHLAMAHLARAHIPQALAEYHVALRSARAHFSGDAALRRVLAVVHGELCWEKGDSQSPIDVARDIASDRVRTEAWFDLHMAATHLTVECLQASGQSEQALVFAREEIAHAWSEGLDRLARFLTSLYVCALLRSGRVTDALEQFGDLDEVALDVSQTWRECEMHARSSLAIAHAKGRVDRVMALANALSDHGQRNGVSRLHIAGLLELALGQQLEGHIEDAYRSVAEAIKVASVGESVRPFLRTSSEIAPLIRQAFRDSRFELSTDERNFATVVLAHAEPATTAAAQPEHQLSAREREMLEHLAQGKPDKVIARDIGLSAHGVRYHLKKLYAKLGVHNRSQAVAEARTRGLGPDS